MIFTKVDALVKDIDVDKYHIETVILSSDDLNKKIIRVDNQKAQSLARGGNHQGFLANVSEISQKYVAKFGDSEFSS